MQKLHLVGITPDLDGLILSTRKGAKSGSFVVAVDSAVLRQLLDAGKSPEPTPKRNGLRAGDGEPRSARPESLLSPREMQDLLRGGWTLEEVAVEAGVDVDWVNRFAAPVRAEIALILGQARDMVFEKPRVGPSALRLGPSVRRNVAERGVRFTDDDFDACWRAYQLDDITWIIEFEYVSRGRHQLAEWTLDLESGELLARNRLGTLLGHVQSTRRKISTAPPPKPKPKAAAVRAVKKAAAAPPPAASTKAVSTPTPAPKRPRTRRPGTRAASSTSSSASGKTSKPPAPVARTDPWREELRRREAERAAERSARRPDPEPAPRLAPRLEPRPAPRPEPPGRGELQPVAVVGPTVRMLSRRQPRPQPAPPRRLLEEPNEAESETADDAGPDLAWAIPDKHGPLPAPGPVAVPDDVRDEVAANGVGRVEPVVEDVAPEAEVEEEPEEPGFVDEPDAELDDAEVEAPVEWAPTPPVRAQQPVFRGASTAKAASRPRRREPLRGR